MVKRTQNHATGKHWRGLSRCPMLPLGQGHTKQAVQPCFGPGKATGSESTSSELGADDSSLCSGERAALPPSCPWSPGTCESRKGVCSGASSALGLSISGTCKLAVQRTAAKLTGFWPTRSGGRISLSLAWCVHVTAACISRGAPPSVCPEDKTLILTELLLHLLPWPPV